MIFVDTNYFMRLILGDDAEQADVVENLINGAAVGKFSLYTSLVCWFEVDWVLKSVYKQPKPAVITALATLLDLREVQFDERSICRDSLTLYEKTNLDLEDCYNIYLALSLKCDSFASFDKKAVKEFGRLHAE